ncbi:hypothetical protein GH714_003248 [Hevea brasiliensis]|uniref:Protein kinase domain-containing protein n=1 Tax=Hevea brasiliensis TaxID=3981 RepID=A0A6A6M899_HEVBR|nr:hypothetical protein GH714_003248 [Hevea brasiliensis]
MKYIRANSLKRLFSLKRRGLEEGIAIDEDKNGISNCKFVQEPEHSSRPAWRCFSYPEIFEATNGFSPENLVGKGGYAEVYRGVLRDGEKIAIKRLTRAGNDERKEKEFLTEIGTIGHMRNFQLWIGKRYKIAIGTARGLHYLHKGCQRRIIHRDIKSSNILLTADFEPLAKPILKQGETEEVVDPRLGGAYDASQLIRLAFAASLCIRASSTWRPTMSEVAKDLFVDEQEPIVIRFLSFLGSATSNVVDAVMGNSDTDIAEYIFSLKPSIDLLDRIPGEPFVPKPSKEAEMEKILRSMEVVVVSWPKIVSIYDLHQFSF